MGIDDIVEDKLATNLVRIEYISTAYLNFSSGKTDLQ
jgi:hypothetical protein